MMPKAIKPQAKVVDEFDDALLDSVLDDLCKTVDGLEDSDAFVNALMCGLENARRSK